MGLRERMASKALPCLPYRVRIDDTTAAEQAVRDAQGELLLALGTDREKDARLAVEAAGALLAACFETITLTAMDPDAFEELVAEHPPREGHPDDEAWNVDTLPRATFLACAPDFYTPEEWVAWLTKCNSGERTDLYNAAVAINVRTVSATLPKDWTSILS